MNKSNRFLGNTPKWLQSSLQHQGEYLRYKWEHLRRSKEYQRDYDASQEAKKQGKHISWPHKYGVFRADYHYEYPGSKEEAVVFFPQFLPSDVLRVDAWSKQALTDSKYQLPYNTEGIEFKKMRGEDIPLKGMKTLRLVIDIRHCKEHLLKEFEKAVDFYKHFVKDLPPNDKKRLQDYKNDLTVWDCYHEVGGDWQKVIRKLKIDTGDKYYDVKKAKRAFLRCQKRIKEGI